MESSTEVLLQSFLSVNHKQETSTVLDNGEEEEMGSDLQNYCQYLKLCKVRGNSEDLGEKNSNEGNRNIGQCPHLEPSQKCANTRNN